MHLSARHQHEGPSAMTLAKPSRSPSPEEGRLARPLHGRSILIVEDEMIIGLMLANEIAGAGGTPLGPVTSVAAAAQVIESQAVDAVILDAKLIDGTGADLADGLA